MGSDNHLVCFCFRLSWVYEAEVEKGMESEKRRKGVDAVICR